MIITNNFVKDQIVLGNMRMPEFIHFTLQIFS